MDNNLVFKLNDWEKYAECYDALLHLKPYTEMLSEVCVQLAKTTPSLVLDASCGTGNFEAIFGQKYPQSDTQIIATDSSKEMLARAKKKHPQGNFFSLVCEFAEIDLNKPIPLVSGSVDAIVSINTLYAMESPEMTLKEFHRTLKKDGKLFIVTPKMGFENGMILKEHCESILPDDYWKDAHSTEDREKTLICEAIKDEITVRNMLTVARYNRAIRVACHFHFFQIHQLELLLHHVGFVLENSKLTYAKQAIFLTAHKR